jgi:(2Fe-2S) ferredoxin
MKITSKDAFQSWVADLTKGKAKAAKVLVGMGTCGLAAGAGEVYTSLEQEVKSRKLNITLSKVGCVGACHSEPSIEFAYPDGSSILLGPVKPEDVSSVLDLHESNKLDGSRFVLQNDYINAFDKGGN